ncbi:Kelch-like protein 6 [Branchiostoma belcheri]|nr:Kelch-like protein 6 [Branchiostoma belcheri]
MEEDPCPSSVNVCHTREELSALFKELQNMRSEGVLVDVTLCAEEKEIPCHRLVLAGNSEYFKLMFNGSHSESRKDKIEIGGVSAEALQQLVDYAYSSKITITTDNVHALFQAADMLQFLGVCDECEDFLEPHINQDTCLGTWALADRVSCTSLAEKAECWALKWFKELCTTEEFLELPYHLLKMYISDERLLAKEEQILEAIMLWARHDLKERKGHLKELLKCVCFSSMDQDYLKNILKEDEVLVGVRGIKQMMKSQSTHTSPRQMLQKDFLVLGGSRLVLCANARGEVEPRLYMNSSVYTLGLDSQCIDTSALPAPFHDSRGIAACVVDGDVIVTGGHESLTQAWRYRPALKSWTKLASLKKGRFNHRMALLQGQVYVVGGSRPVNYSRSGEAIERLPDVEVYKEKTNRWKKVAPLKLAVSSFGIATYGGQIYVFGGEPYPYEGNDLMRNETDAVQRYNPAQNNWTCDDDVQLPYPLSCIQACTVDDRIYIVGGQLECVLCFDPEDSYEPFRDMANTLFPWQHCSATVCGEEIYISGGRVHQLVTDGNGILRQVETYALVQCYNVNSDTMVLCKDLPKPLYGHCTVTVAKT